MHQYAYGVIAGSGLGISFSSLPQVGSLLNHRKLGQAQIAVYTNLTHGNVVVQDRALTIQALNGELILAYNYNSQTKQWCFSQTKRITQLPDGQTAILQEGDGHATVYHYDSQQNIYVAPGCGDGTPWLRLTPAGFEGYHPKTQITEQYDTQGYLQSRTDNQSHTTHFAYNNQHELQTIISPSQERYELRRQAQTVALYAVNSESEILLQTSTFDSNGQLLNTQLPDGYQINYAYDAQTQLLTDISQTDGTHMRLSYEDNRIKAIQAGDAVTTLNYLAQGQVQLQDGAYDIRMHVTEQGRIAERWLPNSQGDWDKTIYNFYPNGQLKDVVNPDENRAEWVYATNTGLLTQHTNRLGEITRCYYDTQHPAELIAKAVGDSTKPAVTRYLFDTDNQRRRYVRFELSPTGNVQQYYLNELGLVAKRQAYLNAVFDVSTLTPDKLPTLAELVAWVNEQPPTAFALTTLSYDQYGQLSSLQRYAKIDEHGNGSNEVGTQEERWVHNRFGSLLEHAVRQGASQYSITTQQVDDLQRVILKIEPTGQKIHYAYQDTKCQRIVQQPNGRQEIEQYDAQGLLTKTMQVVGEHVRTTQWLRDDSGRLQQQILTDGRSYYLFQDVRGRLLYKVSATGIVESHSYNTKLRYRKTIRFDLRIVMADFLKNPTLANLQLLLTPSNQDRSDYRFYDANEQLQYAINAENALKAYHYNAHGKVTTVISYATLLTQSQLDSLLQGEEVNFPVDPHQDRIQRNFYDASGEVLLGEQDAAGYFKAYLRDGANRTIQTICYATPVSVDLQQTDWHKLLPVKSSEDVNHYYFYDNLDKPIREVDGEGYVTDFSYRNDGLLATRIRYYQPVDASWHLNPPNWPPTPTLHTEDEKLEYSYDEKGRRLEIRTSAQKATTTQYDDMGQIVLEIVTDRQAPGEYAGDYQRGTLYRYNGFGERIAKTPAWVTQELLKIEADPSLSPDEKAAQQETIWQTQSLSYRYDETTGLLLAKREGMGTAYYFYDADCRLAASVDPQGAVTEYTLNTQGETIQTRQLYHALDGAENSVLSARLHDDQQDAITTFSRDKLGHIISTQDPEGYINQQVFNAFAECEATYKSVDDKQPSLRTRYYYDTRGLAVLTEQQADNKTLREEKRYANVYGKLTYYKDKAQGEYSYVQDKLGRTIKTVNPLGRTHVIEHDAHNRIRCEVDAGGNITSHQYVQSQRTHTISQAGPDQALSLLHTITYNIFDEAIAKQDALGHVETFSHTPDGQLQTHTDKLGYTTRWEYNYLGWQLAEQFPNGLRNEQAYNLRGELVLKIQDATGLRLTTTYQRNALGHVVELIDANKVHTKQIHDRRGLVTKRIQAAGDLNLCTQTTYNGLQQTTSLIKGDAAIPNQYEEKLLHDGFGRSIGKIIDPVTLTNPQGLAIETQHHLNDAGKVIAKLDPNGNVTRYLYDAAGQLRFRVKPSGAVKAWDYTAQGKVAMKRTYSQGIDPALVTDNTTLDELIGLLTPQTDDTQRYYFYDERQQERFRVNSLGAVVETRYNLVGQRIQAINYASCLELAELASLSLAKLIERIKTLADANQDRVIYTILNAKGQERFCIDAEGYVIEKWYDAKDQVLAEIGYATQIKDPASFAQLPCEQVYTQLTNSIDDRATYYVFDSLGRPQFTINAEGGVIGYHYDALGKLVMECRFKEPIQIPTGYDHLVDLVRQLEPNPQVDRITRKVYDAGSRLVKVMDAQGNADNFIVNAVGNTTAHIDREGHTWQYQLDRAQRIVKEVAPPTTISFVYKKTISPTAYSLLDCKQEEVSIEKETVYDKAGNPTVIIEGANTPEKRTLKMSYDAEHLLLFTSIENVAVNDGQKSASFSERPERVVNLLSEKIYNTQGLEIVFHDEVGGTSFKVYDSEKHLLYSLDKGKGLVKTERNSFGEVVKETRYAMPLELDTAPYQRTGISREILEQHLKTSSEDRVTVFQRDRRGNIALLQKGPIYYYQPNEKDIESGTGFTETLWKYNAFREQYFQGILIDAKHNYAITLWWYNRTGHILAECDPIRHYKRYILNVYNEVEVRKEHALCLSQYPEGISIAEVDKLIQASPYDRIYCLRYNLLGLKTQEKQLAVKIQNIKFGEHSKPTLQDNVTDLTRCFLYDKVGNPIGKVYEDGNAEYTYVNPLGKIIAKADVPRITHNIEGTQLITLIPLTYYGVNPFGEQVLEIRFKQGTAHADASSVPAFIKHDAEDQYFFKLLNSIGLPIYEQNAEGMVVFKTYATSRKLARSYYAVSNWQIGQNWQQNKRVVHIDEQRLVYDEKDRCTRISKCRDNEQYMATQTAYNIFGERVLEGPGDGTFAVYWHYDVLGHCWLTNESQGVATITLTDRQGQPTLIAQSATQDLAKVQYSQFATGFLALGPDQLECTVKVRDYAKNVRFVLSPLYFQNNNWIRPVSHINYDAWGNVWQLFDTRGNLTQFVYNALNKLITIIKPGVNVVMPDGSTQWVAPTVRYGYNARGVQVGKINAYGATTAFSVNQAGQLIQRILPDGTFELTQVWDALGRVVQERDARWAAWNMRYTRMNAMAAMVSPLGRMNEYRINECNQRFYVGNPAGYGWGYNYSPLNKIEARIEPNGYAPRMLFGYRGFVWKVVQPDVGIQEYARDYWGRILSEGDIGGVITYKQYNFKKQLIEQTTGYNERHGNMLLIVDMHYEQHYGTTGFNPILTNLPYYTIGARQLTNQHLTFSYAGDFLKEVVDHAVGLSYRYERDTEGNRVAMRVFSNNGDCIYESVSQLDALGREVNATAKIGGLQVAHSNYYDVESNLLREVHWLAYLNGTGIYSWDRWQGFDTANRVIRQEGFYFNPMRAGSIGLTYGYSQGYRNLERYDDSFPHYINYDGDGLLSSVDVEYQDDSTQGQHVRQGLKKYTYHPVGWLQQESKFYRWVSAESEFRDREHVRIDEYWANEVINCTENGWLSSKEAGSLRTYNTSFTPLGVPLTQDQYGSFIQQRDASHWDTITYKDSLHFQYVGMGGSFQLTGISGTRTQSDGASLTNSAQLLYDVNGNPSGAIRWGHPSYIYYQGNPYNRVIVFAHTYNGMPLFRATFDTHGASGDNFWPTRDILMEHYFYNANEAYLGGQEFGTAKLGQPRLSDLEEWFNIARNSSGVDGAWDDYYQFAKTNPGYSLGVIDIGFPLAINNSNQHVVEWGETHANKLNVPTVVKPLAASFNYRVETIHKRDYDHHRKERNYIKFFGGSDELSAQAPQYHVVQENETFASIAKQYKGTPKLARDIARWNGYKSYEVPPPGYKLFIPELHGNTCQADDEAPFSEIRSKIIGSIQPYLAIIPPPPQQDDDDGNFWDDLLDTFVPLVVGVLFAPFTGGASAMLLAGLTSAATQYITTGRINVLMTLESAVLSYVGAGLASLKEISFKAVMDHFSEYALINGTEQMVEIAANQRQDFDLGYMLSFAVGQTANAVLQGRLDAKLAIEKSNPMPTRSLLDKLVTREEQLLVSNVSAWALAGAPLKANHLAGQMTGLALGTSLEHEYQTRKEKTIANKAAELAAKGRGIASEQAKLTSTKSRSHSFFNSSPGDVKVPKVPQLSIDNVIDKMDQGKANWPSQTKAQQWQSEAKSTSNKWQTAKVQKGLSSIPQVEQVPHISTNLKPVFQAEISDPETIIGATIDHYSGRVERLGLVDKYNRYAVYAEKGAVRTLGNISDSAKSMELYQRYSSLAAKYGFYAQASEFIEHASKLALPLEILEGGVNVVQAKSGTKLQTTFEETGKIVGGSLGFTVGIFQGLAEEVTVPVISTPAAIAGIAIDTSIGASAGKEFADYLYDKIQIAIDEFDVPNNKTRNKF